MSYLDPKIKYMNSVSGSTAGNIVDAEEAYWEFLLEGGSPPAGDITSADISDASTVGVNVLTAADAAAARTAIGAGTSSLAVGTTATTAMAGNKAPTSTQRGGVLLQAAQADSTATDVAGLVTDFNALLAKLRTAGVLTA